MPHRTTRCLSSGGWVEPALPQPRRQAHIHERQYHNEKKQNEDGDPHEQKSERRAFFIHCVEPGEEKHRKEEHEESPDSPQPRSPPVDLLLLNRGELLGHPGIEHVIPPRDGDEKRKSVSEPSHVRPLYADWGKFQRQKAARPSPPSANPRY